MPNLFRKFGLRSDRPYLANLDLNHPYLTKLTLWLGIPAMLLLPSGLGVWAVAQLFGLPELPKCLTVSWTDDNPATRLYCAEISADRYTPQDLQEAIQLVSSISHDHPLRPESDRMIQKWSANLLQLGEAAYQDGKLEEALSIAEKIPDNVRTRTLAIDRMQKWQDTWKQAEELYEEAQTKLQDRNWFGVMVSARRLLTLDNRYWATTQHQELMRQLQVAKEGSEKQILARQKSKPLSSPAQNFLARINQEQTAEAKAHLGKARSLASQGDSAALQSAIGEAQQVIFGSDGYEEAQQLISRWRQQVEVIEDRPHLDRAMALASKDNEADLQAAIAEANQISWGRALYDEANSQVERWRDRVFELETAARNQQLNEMSRSSELTGGGSASSYQPASLPAQPSPAEIEGDRSAVEPIQNEPINQFPVDLPSASPIAQP
ncbi:MAG: hypothetical protein KME15_23645 [Drouetiella hepatica Uher 2000/2452]|jgi:hypothetical protein|uniref:Chromosome segregation ATPase n=1 Tax=Drouetiella hepatica Uher 2000/2452 TaxID=904376 RepID=A0A951QFE0_9CYAN|nr:hypothetical protein [Drouetiella hepatica Uher 2000/2452]